MTTSSAAAAPRVLLLVSDAPSVPGGVALRQVLEQTLATGPQPAEVFTESIDTARFPNEEQDRALASLLAAKYPESSTALVIALAAPALDFAVRHRHELFRSVPLLYGLVDQRAAQTRKLGANIAGVHVKIEAARTMQLAHVLFPNLRNIVVVGGASLGDRGWLDAVRADIGDVELPLDVSYVTGLPLKETLGEVGGLGDDSAVLFVSMAVDGAGVARFSTDVARTLRRATDVPIFGLAGTLVGTGVFGGSVIDYQRHAADIAAKARQILNGAAPDTLASTTTPPREVFDWRELERFHVEANALPAGATIAFRPAGIWALYRSTLLVGGGLAAGLLLVGLLVVQRTRRRESEEALAAHRRLRDLVDELLLAFATVPLRRIDDAITAAFKRIAEVTDADDLWLWEPRNGEDRSWLPLSLLSGESTALDGSGEPLPPVQARLAASGRQATSVVATPLSVAGELLGVLFWVSYDRPLRPQTVHDLRVVSETFGQLLQRKHADDTIERSERLKNTVLSSLPSHIAVLDRDGVIIEVNDAWKRFARENGVQDLSTVMPGASYRTVCEEAVRNGLPAAEEILAGIDASCKGALGEFEREYRVDGPDGQRWFTVRSLPLMRDEGGAVVVHSDITAQKNAERVLHTLSGRLIAAQESERRRIARELHDDLGQRVALLAIEIDQVAMETHDGIGGRIRALGERTAELAVEIHRLAHGLHSSKLDALGLVRAVRGHCREMKALGLDVTFTDASIDADLSADVSLCLFRVVQEALNNVVRHSNTDRADVHLSQEGRQITVRITDAGKGFNVTTASNRGGLGLVGMRERLASLGGTLVVQSRPGAGTTVTASVPIETAQSSDEADAVA
jgi:signal transduction histidine kinase